MNKNTFNRDLSNEEVLGEFLNRYFYPLLGINNFLRYGNKSKEQFEGVDVYFETENQRYLVDEKGYLTRPTIQNTFVLELSYLNASGERKEGWFYDTNKKTTHYLMCWADRDDINIYKDQLTIDHIHRVELMLVDRKKLQDYLQSKYSINRNYISNNHNAILMATESKPVYLENSKSKYNYSKKLREQPLNIVMPKEEYVESSAVVVRYMVYKNGIERL
ncbi:MAG: hypothetical protein ABS948_16685 [Solibacillus sp.]